MPITIDEARAMRGWLLDVRKNGSTPLAVAAAKRCVLLLADKEADFLRAHAHLFANTATGINDIAVAFVAWLSAVGRKTAAAAVLWDEDQFTAEPVCVRRIWAALDANNYVAFIGASGLGKSMSPAIWLLLDWLSDPTGTRVDLVSTDDQKLKGALYAKIVNLHQSASIKLPGVAAAETLSLDSKAGFGFHLQLIQRGLMSSGELKGMHLSARPIPHAIYGKYTRRRVMLDEAEEIPVNVWGQIPNVLASSDAGTDGVKIIATANPKNQNSTFGEHCKPADGWGALPEEPQEWKAAKGATVIRLDVRKTENIMRNKVVFRGFQSPDGFRALLDSCGGDENHPDMWTFGYGFFPPNGNATNLIPQRWLIACQGEWIFTQMPMPVAGFDVALDGGDLPILCTASVGLAAKWRNYAGQEFTLKEPRWVVQVEADINVPPGDTQDVADEAMARCRSLGIEAENLAVDITGMPGVGDVMAVQWNRKVLGLASHDARAEERAPIIRVNYSEKPSTMKISAEDSKTPRDLYDRTATELWYRLSKWLELDIVRIGRGVTASAIEQLTSRRGGYSAVRGGKKTIEPKSVHKKRLAGKSCDRADAITLAIFSAAMRCEGLAPRAKDTPGDRPLPYSQWGQEKAFGRSWRDPLAVAPGQPANLGGAPRFAPTLEGLEAARQGDTQIPGLPSQFGGAPMPVEPTQGGALGIW